MNAFTAAQLFVEHDNQHYNAVQRDTWGHLAPVHRKEYPGYLIFAIGEWGDEVPIAANFKDLPDSPWFFDHIGKFIDKFAGYDKTKQGRVYRFDGTYMIYNNGNPRWRGKVKQINLGKV
jgi:hypothetical protein